MKLNATNILLGAASLLMTLNIFIMGYVLNEVSKANQLAHQIDKNLSDVKASIKIMDGKIGSKAELFDLIADMKKSQGKE